MRQFVMFSLAEKYPELKELVRAEIDLPGTQENGTPTGDARFI